MLDICAFARTDLAALSKNAQELSSGAALIRSVSGSWRASILTTWPKLFLASSNLPPLTTVIGPHVAAGCLMFWCAGGVILYQAMDSTGKCVPPVCIGYDAVTARRGDAAIKG